MRLLEQLAENGWTLHVGDPDVMGWIIFAGYLITSFLCLSAGILHTKLNNQIKDSLFWYGLFIVMLFLGLNKQLDLQVLLISFGRIIAQSQGWFGSRREVQKIFLVVFTLIGIIFTAMVFTLFRKILLKNYFILIGLLFVFAFIIIRASSINHIDFIPSNLKSIGSFHMKNIVELSGILCIGYSAFREIMKKPSV